MKVISAQDGKLVRLQEQEHAQTAAPGLFTGLPEFDKLLPPNGLKLGAIHELIEYASTLMLGPEKGMLKLNSPDAKTDTQKDLANNLLGTLVALGIYSVVRAVRSSRKADLPEADLVGKAKAT